MIPVLLRVLCVSVVITLPVHAVEHSRIERTLRNLLKPAYDNYNWEGNYSIDGFADSIEGANNSTTAWLSS